CPPNVQVSVSVTMTAQNSDLTNKCCQPPNQRQTNPGSSTNWKRSHANAINGVASFPCRARSFLVSDFVGDSLVGGVHRYGYVARRFLGPLLDFTASFLDVFLRFGCCLLGITLSFFHFLFQLA